MRGVGARMRGSREGSREASWMPPRKKRKHRALGHRRTFCIRPIRMMRSSETETSDQQTCHAWVSSYSSGSSVDQPSASVALTTESYFESSSALSFFVRRRSGDFLSFREGE
eukprot:418489-Prymnesium_polylepis.1